VTEPALGEVRVDHRGLGVEIEHASQTGDQRHQHRQQRLGDLYDEVSVGRTILDGDDTAVLTDRDRRLTA